MGEFETTPDVINRLPVEHRGFAERDKPPVSVGDNDGPEFIRRVRFRPTDPEAVGQHEWPVRVDCGPSFIAPKSTAVGEAALSL